MSHKLKIMVDYWPFVDKHLVWAVQMSIWTKKLSVQKWLIKVLYSVGGEMTFFLVIIIEPHHVCHIISNPKLFGWTRVAASIFSKPFVAVFYEFYKPLWLLACCVCLLIVSTPFASMLGI